MNRYYIEHPRNFANEYAVYVCKSERTERRLLELYPNAEKINRAEAIRLGWTRPREAERNGEQWFGRFAEPLYEAPRASNVLEALTEAAQGTLDEINRAEKEGI
jgi:hypothetical protein